MRDLDAPGTATATPTALDGPSNTAMTLNGGTGTGTSGGNGLAMSGVNCNRGEQSPTPSEMAAAAIAAATANASTTSTRSTTAASKAGNNGFDCDENVPEKGGADDAIENTENVPGTESRAAQKITHRSGPKQASSGLDALLAAVTPAPLARASSASPGHSAALADLLDVDGTVGMDGQPVLKRRRRGGAASTSDAAAERIGAGGGTGTGASTKGWSGENLMSGTGNDASSLLNQALLRLDRVWNSAQDGPTGTNGTDIHASLSATPLRNGTDNEPTLDGNVTSAVSKTESLLLTELSQLLQHGLTAFHDRDALQREVTVLKDAVEGRGREVTRLRESERQSRETISNLLRAVEAAKSDARSASRHIASESRLRSELATLRTERDAAISRADESDRRSTLAAEEARSTRARLNRLTQEKNRMERDSRAALSLAQTLDSHSTSDAGYYKRQIGDLKERLGQQAQVLKEQRMEIASLRSGGGGGSTHPGEKEMQKKRNPR